MWHPRGPNNTEAWRWFLIDKIPRKRSKKSCATITYVISRAPGGMTEQDDMENWNYAHNASKGTIARRTPYNYEMGIGALRKTLGFQEWSLKRSAKKIKGGSIADGLP
ncbi:MAG: hypothetical protein Ct9H300mP11_02950 [Chloroflexota bacterium]|nr:MAG: hypothetical protein Ct9H300mP11_02950 [Chloroflexota bacterium]